jgi:2-keto-4-pentenoate hydratase/2-oxohepta-3-ene-1,7-dioic acid hydratase in catechol pathway
VVGNGDEIRYPTGLFKEAWIEVELAFMISKRASNVPAAEAKDYILGYTIANDITATNILGRDHHLARSKSLDSFCPIGPALVTDFEPKDVALISRINGKIIQSARTNERLFDDAACVSFISRALSLEPGDLILTGTPNGTGPGSFGVVRPGDEIALEIPGIGILRNRVVAC